MIDPDKNLSEAMSEVERILGTEKVSGFQSEMTDLSLTHARMVLVFYKTLLNGGINGAHVLPLTRDWITTLVRGRV